MTDFLDNEDLNKFHLLTAYIVHLHAIQAFNTKWQFVIEIYPEENKSSLKEPVMFISQASFPIFEYAIEAGVDILETLGYSMVESIAIDVYELSGTNYNLKLIIFDGDNFRVESETLITQEEYNKQFKAQI